MSLYVIPSDSPSVFDMLTNLSQAQQLAIVRPNNPPPGIAGFLFQIPGDEELRLRTLISRHYLEDNTPVQDAAALEPEEIKLTGLIAELSTGLPSTAAPATIPDTLPLNPVLVPTPTAGQVQAAAVATPNSDTTGGATNLYEYQQATAPLQPNQTKQSNAAAYLYQLWLGRVQFSVETPFGVMNNMMIQDARCLQEAKSRQISTFTLVFQKIRVVGSAVVQAGQLAGRRVLQVASATQNGVAGLTPLSATESASLFRPFA